MKQIIDKYKKWRTENTDDYCYDEIFSFFETLSRGELLSFMDETVKSNEIKQM